MSLRPATFVRLAVRAARRRRYGYAALRVLRCGLRRAIAEHFARSVGPAPYASEVEEIRARYSRGIAELLRKFPSLGFNLDDERARP